MRVWLGCVVQYAGKLVARSLMEVTSIDDHFGLVLQDSCDPYDWLTHSRREPVRSNPCVPKGSVFSSLSCLGQYAPVRVAPGSSHGASPRGGVQHSRRRLHGGTCRLAQGSAGALSHQRQTRSSFTVFIQQAFKPSSELSLSMDCNHYLSTWT